MAMGDQQTKRREGGPGAGEFRFPDTPEEYRRRWYAYYSEKRIVHQWFQVHLLQDLDVRRVLEIGPYLGLVTTMLSHAGYEVTTLDVEPRAFGFGGVRHITADVRTVAPETIRGFDCILCCETLEHVPWDEVDGVLRRFRESGAPWLVLSVPFEGTQIGFSFYANRFTIRRRSFLRKFRFLRRFPAADRDDWAPHKWEIGFHGHGLSAFRRKIEEAGYAVTRQEFTSGCRSVFLVCRNQAAGPAPAGG